MKQPAQSPNLQLNLPLQSAPATVMPDDKHKDLTLALIELLMSAADSIETEANGGGDESETYR